jgi:DNA (cytosine-5)-methyltransferase 1
VLDAQFFGLAQRRKRVFIVRDTGDWTRRPPVLLESSSLQGNPAPRREAGERIAGPIAGCSNGGGANGPGRTADDADSLIAHALKADGFDASEDGTGRGVPLTVTDDLSRCLNAGGQGRIDWETETFVPVLADPICGNANAGGQVAVAFAQNQRDEVREMDIAGERAGEPGMKQQTFVATTAVRRLVPEECEALQGFSRGYTNITYRGKPAADGPRYKSLGNSFAVPVVRWIGKRIAMVNNLVTDALTAPDNIA